MLEHQLSFTVPQLRDLHRALFATFAGCTLMARSSSGQFVAVTPPFFKGLVVVEDHEQANEALARVLPALSEMTKGNPLLVHIRPVPLHSIIRHYLQDQVLTTPELLVDIRDKFFEVYRAIRIAPASPEPLIMPSSEHPGYLRLEFASSVAQTLRIATESYELIPPHIKAEL